MSKRRHRKIETSEKHEHQEHHESAETKHEEAKHEYHAHEGRHRKNAPAMKIVSFVAVAVIFFVVGYFISSMGGIATAKTNDELIFISPPGCTSCAEMEPVAKAVADVLRIPFVKTGFGQSIETPGFMLVYKNISTISGVGDEYTFKTQICLITNNTDVCNQAKQLTPEAAEEETPTVPKSDRPEAHAFVMSYCPYGLQFLKAYVPVIELLGDKADLSVNFVHYIMHGEKEMLENTRMYCIQKEQNDKFTQYLRCFVEDGNYSGCISEVGIDSAKLDACMKATDTQFQLNKTFFESGETYPPYDLDKTLAAAYDVGGSPTFGINGQQVSVSRSAEAIKQAICSAFNTPPAECSQTLSSTAEAPSFGAIGAGSGSSSGEC